MFDGLQCIVLISVGRRARSGSPQLFDRPQLCVCGGGGGGGGWGGHGYRVGGTVASYPGRPGYETRGPPLTASHDMHR